MSRDRKYLLDKSQAFRKIELEEPYERNDLYFVNQQKKCTKLIKKLNHVYFDKNEKRNKLFSKLFASYGKNNVIKEGFVCNLGSNIHIGDNCFFNYNVTILDSYKVFIGNNVLIAPNVIISPVEHPLKYGDRTKNCGKNIVIEDNVWIGAGAIILPGVTLKSGCVVGAGAVVRKDVEANTVVAGVPAKFIKKIEN